MREIYSTEELELLKDIPWVWTEKVDGTNIHCINCPQNENCMIHGLSFVKYLLHFDTGSEEAYESVQNECRKQIGSLKI